MKALDYQSAIQLLESGTGRRTSNQRAAMLGECYRRSGRFDEAEDRFRRVEDWSEVKPQYLLHFARTLQRSEKYAEALAFFERYLGRVPRDRVAREQAAACRNIRELQGRGMGWWEVQSLPFNTEYREFGPAIFDRGLVFSSDRPVEGLANYRDAWTGEGFLDLFLSSRETLDTSLCTSYTYGDPEVFDAALSSRFHEASPRFTAGFQEIYYTGSAPGGAGDRDDNGVLQLQVLHAWRLPGNGGWTGPAPLSINSNEYSVMHPCPAPDGRRLYFASDMPGGYGGLDLYYAERTNGVWGPAFNLGPGVNTPGSEAFPYLDLAGDLYFSSDGWGGLGGLDLFSTRQKKRGGWETPRNLGAPLNSAADDFGFAWNVRGKCGYLSSDRKGGAGKDDIYAFRKIAHPVRVSVRDAVTGANPGGGYLTADCRQDTLRFEAGQALWEIPHNACCELKAKTPGYQAGTAIRCTYNLPPGEPLEMAISLAPNPVYRLEGVVFQESTRLPVEDVDVQAIDRATGRVVATYHTNFSGRFEMEIEDDICYLVKAVKRGLSPTTVPGPCVPRNGSSQTYMIKVYMK